MANTAVKRASGLFSYVSPTVLVLVHLLQIKLLIIQNTALTICCNYLESSGSSVALLPLLLKLPCVCNVAVETITESCYVKCIWTPPFGLPFPSVPALLLTVTFY